MDNVLRIKIEADDGRSPIDLAGPPPWVRDLQRAGGDLADSETAGSPVKPERAGGGGALPPKPPTDEASANSPDDDRERKRIAREQQQAERERIAELSRSNRLEAQIDAEERRKQRTEDRAAQQAERAERKKEREADRAAQKAEREEQKQQRDAERAAAKVERERVKAEQKAEREAEREQKRIDREQAKADKEAAKNDAKEQKKKDYMGANATQGGLWAASAARSGGGASSIVGGVSQVAQSGALGGEAAAMAAGPAGAAALAGAAVLDFAVEQSVKATQKFQRGITEAGEGVRALARDDLWAVARNRLENYTKDLEEIPIVGKLYAARMKAAAEPLIQGKEIIDSFVARGRQLSQYNGPASAASANADVRALLADIREGQRLGTDYARLIDSQSRLETVVRDGLLPIKERLLNGTANVMDFLARLVEIAVATGEKIGDMVTLLKNLPGLQEVAKYLDNLENDRVRDRAERSAQNGDKALQAISDWIGAYSGPVMPANAGVEAFDARQAQWGPINMP